MSEVIATHELKFPLEIKIGKGEHERVANKITKLEFKRPKGKHLRAMDKVEGEVSKTLALIGAMTGVPASALDELDVEDFADVSEIVEPFFEKLRPTGETSSQT